MKKIIYIFILILVSCSNNQTKKVKEPIIEASVPDSTDKSDKISDDSDLTEDWMWIILLSD